MISDVLRLFRPNVLRLQTTPSQIPRPGPRTELDKYQIPATCYIGREPQGPVIGNVIPALLLEFRTWPEKQHVSVTALRRHIVTYILFAIVALLL